MKLFPVDLLNAGETLNVILSVLDGFRDNLLDHLFEGVRITFSSQSHLKKILNILVEGNVIGSEREDQDVPMSGFVEPQKP